MGPFLGLSQAEVLGCIDENEIKVSFSNDSFWLNCLL